MDRVVIVGRVQRATVGALTQGVRALGMQHVGLRGGFEPSAQDFADARAVFVDGVRSLHKRWHVRLRNAKIPVYIVELARLRATSGSDNSNTARHCGIYKDSLAYMPANIGNRAVVAGVLASRTPEYFLVCAQKPDDTQHNMDATQVSAWTRQTIADVKHKYPNARVCFRPHPKAATFGSESELADCVSDPATETLRDALQRAHALVTFNSTAGVDAIDAGVPVLYNAPTALVPYADYAAPLGLPVETLSEDQRRICLLRLAACTWTLQQLRDGTALRCLLLNAEWPEAALVTLSEDGNSTHVEKVAQASTQSAEQVVLNSEPAAETQDETHAAQKATRTERASDKRALRMSQRIA